MFPAIKKGNMVKSESSIDDVVAPVENFERNQKCLASCDIGLCIKSVKNMKDKEIIDLVNNVSKPLTNQIIYFAVVNKNIHCSRHMLNYILNYI